MSQLFAPFQWKIFRSPLADYCDEGANPETAYRQDVLQQIRRDGFNAIWLRVVLRETVGTAIFPELKPKGGLLERLREIVTRCQIEGLGVFVYLNEPLGFPEDHEFWKSHPELRGHRDRSFDDGWDRANALCSSQPDTRLFLESASRELFSKIPELAGVILITASEHLTHCFSHESRYLSTKQALRVDESYPMLCPRCALRTPAEIIAEIVSAIESGVRSARPDAAVLVWNWSWGYFDPAPHTDILSKLPRNVTIMADFERGGRQMLALEHRTLCIDVDEYSLGYTGPSEAFKRVAKTARQFGLGLMAKLQIGTTHEIATVPNLPLIPNLVRKVFSLRECGAVGFTATWCLGTFASLNTFAVGWLCWHPEVSSERLALSGIARDYFPGCDVERVVGAWERFALAFTHFPQMQDFLYVGPINAAPAYPWDAANGKLRPSWFPPEPYGDQFSACASVLSMEELIQTLRRLVEIWGTGLAIYESGLRECADAHARVELGVSKAIQIQIQSAINLLAYHTAVVSGNKGEIHELRQREIDNLRELLVLMRRDHRLGFHQGCFPQPQYFYDTSSVEAKIDALESMVA